MRSEPHSIASEHDGKLNQYIDEVRKCDTGENYKNGIMETHRAMLGIEMPEDEQGREATWLVVHLVGKDRSLDP